ncbi:LysE family translocator [Amaricoccus macauensis]|uniref:LysE family translocator n=1 Tax=Amaricoccus macauensis TaxID=57001 RepID=UPI003C7E6D1A
MDILTLATFLPLGLALNLTPGPDMMFCIAQGMRSGPRTAAAASLGVSLGAMVHVTIAGLGLGALFARNPALLDAIRWIGAGYLLWIAWNALRAPAARMPDTRMASRAAFRQGLVVNLTNPKVILFVLAFIPQFVSPQGAPVFAQFIAYGLVIALGGFLVNAGLGAAAGRAGIRLQASRTAERWVRRCAATIFGALALRLVFAKSG